MGKLRKQRAINLLTCPLCWLMEWTEQWKHQGLQQGLQQGEAALFLRLAELRFGPLSADTRHRIESADAETLLRWGENLLTAGSLDEVFSEP